MPEDLYARLMASLLHNGSINLLSGWCGFWRYIITLSCWCFPHSAPFSESRLNMITRIQTPWTWEHGGTHCSTESSEAEDTHLLITISLFVCRSHTPLSFETFPQLVNVLLLCQNRITFSDEMAFYYSGLWNHFWISEKALRLKCVFCHVNIQPWDHKTMDLFKCRSIFTNIKK